MDIQTGREMIIVFLQKISGLFKSPQLINAKAPEPLLVKSELRAHIINSNYSPHIHLISKNDAFDLIKKYRSDNTGTLSFLDIGGRHGECAKYAVGYEYSILEIDPDAREYDVITGDITCCPHIQSNSYDIVFSNNVLEHVKRPWDAAIECVRICKPGGLLVHIAPFSWRYHPFPEDNYRFSHTGLAYLFEESKQVKTLMSGYDISKRRVDSKGGKVVGNLDVPPQDELGGWRENWLTIYVGQKCKQE